MNKLADISIIIVTYKTDENILFNCLNSINRNIKIIIVENSNNKNLKKKLFK